MADWHYLKNKETGEEQEVASLDNIDLTKWTAVRRAGNRASGQFERVKPNGEAETVTDLEKMVAAAGRYGRMSQLEMAAWMESMEARIAALENPGERPKQEGEV